MKMKVKEDNIIKRIGIFAKEKDNKRIVIISIISEGLLIEEEHITLSREQAINFLKKSLEEIEKRGEWKRKRFI